jgi:hypothetical protein
VGHGGSKFFRFFLKKGPFKVDESQYTKKKIEMCAQHARTKWCVVGLRRPLKKLKKGFSWRNGG